jgi:hypothetical protein
MEQCTLEILAMSCRAFSIATAIEGERPQCACCAHPMPIVALSDAVIFDMETLQMAFEPLRRKYASQIPLDEGGDGHAVLEDLTQFLKRVARLMARLFQTTHLAVLVNDGGSYRPVETLGYAVTPAVSFSHDSDILKHLERQAGPASVSFDNREGNCWVWHLPHQERVLLEDLCADVLAPIRLNGRLLAVVSLGPKKSGELYSRIELNLLQMLGAEEQQDRISA